MATRRRRGLADCNRAYMEPEENDSSEAASESDDIELIDCDVDSDEIDVSVAPLLMIVHVSVF